MRIFAARTMGLTLTKRSKSAQNSWLKTAILKVKRSGTRSPPRLKKRLNRIEPFSLSFRVRFKFLARVVSRFGSGYLKTKLLPFHDKRTADPLRTRSLQFLRWTD